MSISNFWALTMWLERLQKVSCKALTMMVRRKDGIGTGMLHFTRNSKLKWRPLQIMTKGELKMAPRCNTFYKESRVLSWRQQSILSEPNQGSIAWILMQMCLILAKWSQRRATQCNPSTLLKQKVSQQNLKWRPTQGR